MRVYWRNIGLSALSGVSGKTWGRLACLFCPPEQWSAPACSGAPNRRGGCQSRPANRAALVVSNDAASSWVGSPAKVGSGQLSIWADHEHSPDPSLNWSLRWFHAENFRGLVVVESHEGLKMETLAPCSFSASIILPSSFQHASIPFQHPVRSPPFSPPTLEGLGRLEGLPAPVPTSRRN